MVDVIKSHTDGNRVIGDPITQTTLRQRRIRGKRLPHFFLRRSIPPVQWLPTATSPGFSHRIFTAYVTTVGPQPPEQWGIAQRTEICSSKKSGQLFGCAQEHCFLAGHLYCSLAVARCGGIPLLDFLLNCQSGRCWPTRPRRGEGSPQPKRVVSPAFPTSPKLHRPSPFVVGCTKLHSTGDPTKKQVKQRLTPLSIRVDAHTPNLTNF